MKRGKGFTLLEVMLALAVFALSASILVGFNARGYLNEGRARRLTTAVELAKTKMVEFQMDLEKEMSKGAFPEDKSDSGTFEKPFDEYKWKVELRKVELPIPPIGGEEGGGGEGGGTGGAMQQMLQVMTKQISEAMREIKLTVSWVEMEKEKSFNVVTHIVKM
jgi:prepilin-type N-terminal cleavage/methylation domain-containing protein